MVRKRINHQNEYAVTRIGYCVGGDVEKARVMAHRAGRLRSDIWNKYGSLKCWGIPHQQLYKEFPKTNPPSYYQLDQKQWQKTFERVIDDIHAVQFASKVVVRGKICQKFKPSFADDISAANVAEVYIKGESNGMPDFGFGDGSWTFDSAVFMVGANDVLNIDVAYLYELAVGIDGWNPGEDKRVVAEVFWRVLVVDTITGAIVDGIDFLDTLELGFTNGELVNSGGTSDMPLLDSLTLTEGVEIVEGNNYQIRIQGTEFAQGIAQNTTPEPGTILGLLAVGGLGLGLKRKQEQK